MRLDWPVYHLGVIDSTNTEAQRRAKAGHIENCWLVAESQTAGRGRLQRPWLSSSGNLFSSAFFREPGGISIAARLPFATALAVSDMAAIIAPGAPVKLKWPNDARVNQAKLSGILIETGGQGQDFWVVAGIGINIAECPEGTSQATTCIHDLRGDTLISAEDALSVLRETFARRLEQARQSFEPLREDWLKVAEGLGETVRVTVSDSPVEGVFEDMAPDGALILRLPNGERQMIRAGDVSLIGRT
ncbi:biotin--[acetyl-CoA-carboxylase] ligase [Hyphomonas beringensis]|uniref:biotin--[acetyl-CoA-carboxylase] ligase n=1 Tax=Hyphomonas beringensis TaxID=1280946 RepID=UPI000557F0EB|nr:biotin--[acetyl-CoA-carboxylase] ligase [Hyphomonas beringensis]